MSNEIATRMVIVLFRIVKAANHQEGGIGKLVTACENTVKIGNNTITEVTVGEAYQIRFGKVLAVTNFVHVRYQTENVKSVVNDSDVKKEIANYKDGVFTERSTQEASVG